MKTKQTTEMTEIGKLVKTLKCRHGWTVAQALPIAKRAFRRGVRSVWANWGTNLTIERNERSNE